MKISLVFAACTLAVSYLGITSTCHATLVLGDDQLLTFTDTKLGGYTMPYNLFLPSNYDPSGPALPVILFLHGAGERGSNNTSQTAYIDGLLSATQRGAGSFRAIVIAPQCPLNEQWNSINNNDNWTPGGKGVSSYAETAAQQATRPVSKALQAAMDILTYVQSTQKVDTSRTYVTGLSMGGFGTWEALTRFSDRFAAGLPLSGGGNRLATDVLTKVPVWAFHGESDNVVPSNGSTDVIDAIRNAGGTEAMYTLVPGLGHSGWGEFYTSGAYKIGYPYTTGNGEFGDSIYSWMFAQSLPEPASLGLLLIGSLTLVGRRR